MTADEADRVAADAAALEKVATVRIIEQVKPDNGEDFIVQISTVFPATPRTAMMTNVGQWVDIKGDLT